MDAHLPLWRRRLTCGLAGLMICGSPWQAALAQTPVQAPVQAPSQVRLPSLGEAASEDLSVGAERRIGEQIMREARRDPEFLDDPTLQAYLLAVFNPLVAAARQVGNIDADTDHVFAWEPFLVKDRSFNAFALPGGYVGVHLGLIATTSNVDQLASVLAHELSHVTQRHIARSIAPQAHASMLAIATMLLGIIAAARANNADIANAAIMGGQGAAIQGQLNFSRDMEREADRVGYGLMATAGYAPSGMASMFDKLEGAMRLSDNGSYPYLRTHPLTTDRISEARNRTLLGNNAPSVPTLRHGLMQMRSRVLMAEGVQALQRFSGSTTSPQRIDRIAALYGAALAASLLNEHAAAERGVDQALQMAGELVPREPSAEQSLRLLQAEVRLAARHPGAALQALDELTPPPADDPAARPALLFRAQALLDQHRADPSASTDALRHSTEALQTWLAEHPHDPLAWELAAASSDSLGLKLRAMRAAAEARYVVGDLSGAIDRLRAAQQNSRSAAGADFIEGSVIDTRLRQITALRRQLQLEARGEKAGGGRSEPGTEPPPQ